MEINRVVVGYLETNCYVLVKDNECLVIDPGDEIDKIKKVIGDKKVVGVIITHHHFDHVGALKYFDDNLILDKSNLKEQDYQIGPFNFTVIYTPGHKEDLITIYFKEDKSMFVGDFIFKNSIGRTDLPGGNDKEMLESIKKIKKYPDLTIYPGHGDKTTLQSEIENNPYFKI